MNDAAAGVTLVVTLLNEAESLDALLSAIEAQTLRPAEVVIVDGGSTDGSLERLGQWSADRPWVKLLSAPGANISSGRNIAISQASNPNIAVTDAGCIPEPHWLEEITKPILDKSADVAMGFYRAEAAGMFERIVSCLNLPDASEVKPEKFMPSSRSLAFTRPVWRSVDGYPQWLKIGEDMYFNFCVLKLGVRRRFVPGAVVRWRLKPSLRSTYKQYFNYARGDAIGGMYIYRHALRFFAYGAGVGLLGFWLVFPGALLAPAALAAYWLFPAYRRAFRRLKPRELVLAIFALPFLHVILDIAKMQGYLSGIFDRNAFDVESLKPPE